MDDASTPNLLSLPYIGFADPAFAEIYQNTRRFVLSKDNPYYYEGKCGKGLGSPHYIWHMGLSMPGLTSTDPQEMREVPDMLVASDADTIGSTCRTIALWKACVPTMRRGCRA